MDLTVEQIVSLAPDASSAANGKKLASPKDWMDLGKTERILWGKCKGSAVYEVMVDLNGPTTKCSCPSRKFPCKHGLGLMLMVAQTPAKVPDGDPPPAVAKWIEGRDGRADKKAEKLAEKKQEEEAAAATPESEEAAKKREEEAKKKAEKSSKAKADRRKQVLDGIQILEQVLADRVRTGLAALDSEGDTFWKTNAQRLVDAKAGGLANRIKQLAEIPNSGPDWPDRLLGSLGRMALLSHAFERIDSLPPELQEDIYATIGFNVKEEDVLRAGERVKDRWVVIGAYTEELEDKLRGQRVWLRGLQTGRTALIAQYAFGTQPFKTMFLSGIAWEGELVYYPGASRQRAILGDIKAVGPHAAPLPGYTTAEDFLKEVADKTAAQPWLDAFGCVLEGVTPFSDKSGWWVQDRTGASLPLAGRDHWKLLALSGGHPVTLSGEWAGGRLRVLGLMENNHFRTVGA